MPAKKQERPEMPKDLPMPRYDYQKPAGGSFSVRYEDRKPTKPEPVLQNVKFA